MRLLRHRIHVIGFSLLACFLFSHETFAQSTPRDLEAVLGEEILAPSAALLQMKSFILSRVARPPAAGQSARNFKCEWARRPGGEGRRIQAKAVYQFRQARHRGAELGVVRVW